MRVGQAGAQGTGWRWRWLVRCCLAWAWLCAPAAASAVQDRVREKAFWHEPCAERGAEPAAASLAQQDFRPYEGLLAEGYGACAVWVRLLLAPADGDTVLRMVPPYLDEVRLHDPLLPAPLVAGDRHPRAPGAQDRVIALTVPGGAAPRQVWLRLATSSTRLMDVQALSPRDAAVLDRIDDRWQSAFLLLLALPLLWAVVQWWHLRERVLGVFAVKQAATLAWALLILGYGPGLLHTVLPPGAIDRLTSVSVLLVVFVSIWFDRALLATYDVPRWGLRLLAVLAAAFPLLLALLFAGQASAALRANACVGWAAGLLVTLLYLRAGAQAAGAGPLSPRVLAMAYGAILLAVSLAFATNLGLLPGRPAALAAVYGHGLLTGVVMMVLLNARLRLQARALRDLAAAHDRIALERRHREEQENLVGMLVHEMRTPLAAVRMLLGDGRPLPAQLDAVQRSLADMNGLLERCAQASQLDGGDLQPQWADCDLWQAVQELAGGSGELARLAVDRDPALAQRRAAVQADAQWLHIILRNLLDNACRYSPAGSRVQLALRPQDALVDGRAREGFAVDVANLPGAAGWPDARALFTKYYRSPQARRSTGSGLGLYLVAGLAQRLNGQVRYEPTPTQIRFRLWLPA